MLSDFAEEKPIDGKQADITFMRFVGRYTLHGIRRYALHHMRHNALLGIRRDVFAWCVAAYVLCCAQAKSCGKWIAN